jgi:hypothetical protein
MKTGFTDPIASKRKEFKKDTPWDFQAPEYDQRSSCFVDASSNYGVGHKNPVGRIGNPKMRVPTMPFGRPPTMKVAEVAKHEPNAEFYE